MQLLRDNLTLWTSSDGGEPEGAAASGETKDKAEGTAEAPAAAPTEEKTEAAAPSES